MILDASAAVDLLIPSRHQEALWQAVERAPFLAAPQLLLVEVPMAVARLQRRGVLAAPHAEHAVEALSDLPLELIDHRALLAPAFELRHHVRLSDGFYLAAARLLEVPLLTTDLHLARGHHGVPIVDVGSAGP